MDKQASKRYTGMHNECAALSINSSLVTPILMFVERNYPKKHLEHGYMLNEFYPNWFCL